MTYFCALLLIVFQPAKKLHRNAQAAGWLRIVVKGSGAGLFIHVGVAPLLAIVFGIGL